MSGHDLGGVMQLIASIHHHQLRPRPLTNTRHTSDHHQTLSAITISQYTVDIQLQVRAMLRVIRADLGILITTEDLF